MRLSPSCLMTRRRLLRWLSVAGILLAVWLLASWYVAYRLTRRPRPQFAEPAPAVAWGELQPRRLATRDGQELGAWYAEGSGEGPSVVLVHGNGGSRRNCLDRAGLLAREGCAVLLVTARAHGDSTGEFNDIGFGARHDVVAAVEFVERHRSGRPIVVLGTSLGAAAATFAAGELGRRVRGYILESPYRDLKTAVWNRVDNALPPPLDRVAYWGLAAVSPIVLPDLDRISPHEAVAATPPEVPILIVAGGQDWRARPEEARAIHDCVRGHARLVLLERAAHLNFLEVEPDRYREAILDFVRGIGLPSGRR
jgi:pimeloyl-ACP methyl ester carboxylesterase